LSQEYNFLQEYFYDIHDYLGLIFRIHFNFNWKGQSMDSENFKDQCSDITKEFKLQIPCKLAERAEKQDWLRSDYFDVS